ncbi:hypothetical protein BDP27DRAFT_1397639 [Rhodocollybia butyracea]|uniref:Uncharacterized protein n=1 Tax=Rhodocollybia butyracea TaxID=206335 RepID=A0A9P5Q985_9AGAR|nr:hypothetical protein BDP27DRAFT_1397639 [Rhodocollybia butyracea]
MTNIARSHLRRFQPHDASFDRPNRTKRTHTDVATISALKKLSPRARLERNFEIMAANAKRRLKLIAKVPNVSDIESLITVDTFEFNDIRSEEKVFEEYKAFLDPATIAELKRRNKEDWEKECAERENAANPAPSQVQNNPMPAPVAHMTVGEEPDVSLTKHDPTQPADISFPDIMLLTPNVTRQFPLNFFTEKNVNFINARINDFKRVKNSHIPGKPLTLDIADIQKLMKESPEAGPYREEDMTFVQWLQASDNHYLFKCSRYKDKEDAARPKFFIKHYGFFSKQPEAESLFPYWRSHELDLRKKHFELNRDFAKQIQTGISMKNSEETANPPALISKPTRPPPIPPPALHITLPPPLVVHHSAVDVVSSTIGVTVATMVETLVMDATRVAIPFHRATRKVVPVRVASDAVTRDTVSMTMFLTPMHGPLTMETTSNLRKEMYKRVS